MPPYQERAIAEQEELSLRLTKLVEFIGGAIFITLPVAEQVRLRLQKHYMTAYREILATRIANFR